MNNEKRLNLDWTLILIIIGAALFYLPFIPKNFIGDDWLWLSNAKKALSDPIIFFQRPMYGYLRPFNMIVMAIMYKIYGLNSYVFGLGNILLHAANIYLLSEVLRKFNVENRLRLLGCFIFAFYYLNAPVVTWVATGHDIWVTFLSLLFVLQIETVYKRPNLGGFLLAWALALSAVLFKESGFVTIGLYFLIAILLKRSPFKGKLKYYTAFFIMTFFAYLVYYAITRTYADKQLDFGIGAIVNLWYFTGYAFLPMSKRIVDIIPPSFVPVLKASRILLAVLIPSLSYLILRRGPSAVKFFLLWLIMYVSTIAIMNWDAGLFSLYPNDTAGRFYYTVNVGVAVILAWVIIFIYDRIRARLLSRKFVLISLGVLFISLNMGIVYKTTRIYAYRQEVVGNVISDFNGIPWVLADSDTLVVLIDKKYDPIEEIVESEMHVKAIVFLTLDKKVNVQVVDKSDAADAGLIADEHKRVMAWDVSTRHLKVVATNQNRIM